MTSSVFSLRHLARLLDASMQPNTFVVTQFWAANSVIPMALIFCLAEDRGLDEVGLRLCLVTLGRWCPQATVYVYRHAPTDDFRRWVTRFPRLILIPERPPGGTSWNCKPHALLPLLEKHPEVIWLDSDIMLSRACDPLFPAGDDEELVLVEEPASLPDQGTAMRTKAWGLPLGRGYATTLNTCVMKVTRRHRPLLQRWETLLNDPTYLAAQTEGVEGGLPPHLRSDQDVLSALLGSRDFDDVSVRLLRPGRDVLHSGGALAYSASERLRGLVGRIPPIVHGGGAKPWVMFHPDAKLAGWFWWYRRLLQEVSTYVALARKHRTEINLETPWLDCGSLAGLVFRGIGFGHFALRGLPLTVFATAIRAARAK